MTKHLKWIMTLMFLSIILVGCNTNNGATNDQPENVTYGPNQNNANGNNQNGNNNDFPFFDGNNDQNTNFPYEADRGYNYNHRNNEVEPNNQQPNTQNQNNATAQNANINQVVQEVIRLTNDARKRNGLSALKIDQELVQVAQKKAVDMADNGYFSHNSPTYGSPSQMLDQFGVEHTVSAENIAAGQETAQQVVKAWMNSEGHRKNILNDSVTHIGVGFEKGGNMGTYWSQLFIAK